MMKSQRSDTERNKLMEDGKRMRIGEIINQMKELGYRHYKTMFKMYKNTGSINSRVLKTSNGRKMFFTKWAVSNGKNSRFIKKQNASSLSSLLGIETPLSKIHYWVVFCFRGINMLIQGIK